MRKETQNTCERGKKHDKPIETFATWNGISSEEGEITAEDLGCLIRAQGI